MGFILNISLIDAASFVALIGTVAFIFKVSARTGKSIFRLIIGLERKVLIESSTVNEKIFFAILFVFFFVLGSLWIHGIKTIGDLIAKI